MENRTEDDITMKFIYILRTLQTQLGKEKLLLYGHLQRTNPNRPTGPLNYHDKLKMAN